MAKYILEREDRQKIKVEIVKKYIEKNIKTKNKTEIADLISAAYPKLFKTAEYTRNYVRRYYPKEEYKPHKVLAFGCLHLPFQHEDYLGFLKDICDRFQPTRVVMTGDLFDNHSMTFHEVNCDGFSAGEELKAARKAVKPFVKQFPELTITLGNHDRLPFRRASASGISRHILRDPQAIWDTPDSWTYSEDVWIDNVRYCHLDGMGHAFELACHNGYSVVGSHWHSEGYVSYRASSHNRVFGAQTGCGIDYKSYAFDYGKSTKAKPLLGCVIVKDGVEAEFVPMRLETQRKSSIRI